MKANKLMINDWVIYDGNPTRITGFDKKKISVSKASVLLSHDYLDTDIVKPISLTEEILKANGWEGSPTGDLYIYMPLWDSFMIEVLPSKGAHLFRYHDKRGSLDMHEDTIRIHFHYVHELQHALCLCGLTELADNFKLN